MSSTQDCILTALGEGHINDLLLSYYLANGAASSDINDAEREFLIANGSAEGHINDMWYELLSGLGYAGALQDMKNVFWCVDGGALAPAELWTPADIVSGDIAWFDPTDPTTMTPAIGSAISEWYDKIGGVKKFEQATANSQPSTGITTVNGKNVVSSNYKWMAFLEPSNTYPSSYMVITGFRKPATASNDSLIGRYAFNSLLPNPVYRNNNLLVGPVNASSSVVSNIINMTDPIALTYYVNGTNRVERENSTIVANDVHGSAYADGGIQTMLGTTGKGTLLSPTDWFDIIIGEQISLDDIQRCESYIAWKYGFQADLDPSNPYALAPPTKAA